MGSGKRNKAVLPVVLVVDDVEDNREVYAATLRRSGFAVELAVDGEDAVLRAQLTRPDVVVMDLAMPGVDGWEAARRIRALPELQGSEPSASGPARKRVVILALSAYVDRVSRRLAMDAGCDDFLTKPCLPSTLVERIRAALASVAAR